jgi:glucosamine 6-phosphate synthetase-like amidotransferase/phosphosugar isomerase protein
MCGIAGIFDVQKSKKLERVKLAKHLMLAIEQRGRHASGYAYHGKDSIMVEKADMTASDFVQAAPLFTEPFKLKPRSILLHTRYATQGSPRNNYNNHPIYSKISGLTLIHNGWLTNEREVIAKFNLDKDGEVDSETVLRLIEHFVLNERKRITTAIKLAMRELEGRFACALISEKYPDTLWLWRNGNPLYCYRDERTGALIFASTAELLEEALRASGFTGGKIAGFEDRRVSCMKAIKGKIHASFAKLGKRAAAKRQKPIKNDLPLIGMPVRKDGCQLCFGICRFPESDACQHNVEESRPIERHSRTKAISWKPTNVMTKEAWEDWKKQGKSIAELIDDKATKQ